MTSRKEKQIRIIVKKANESEPVEKNVLDRLETFQNLVGGDIELVYFGIPDLRIVCDDLGKIKHKEPNFRLMYITGNNSLIETDDYLSGDIVFVGVDDREGNFRSIKQSEIRIIKNYIQSGIKHLYRR